VVSSSIIKIFFNFVNVTNYYLGSYLGSLFCRLVTMVEHLLYYYEMMIYWRLFAACVDWSLLPFCCFVVVITIFRVTVVFL
jgi:hypothetical protein